MPSADSACAAPLRHRGDDRADPAEAAEDEADHEGPGSSADGEAAPGVGTWTRPIAMPTASPSASPPTLMSDMPRSLSPRYVPTSAIRARGAMTRSRSPMASTKVSCATRSTSPRRTRLTVAPNFSSRSSSPTVWPTSGLFERVTRRKSRSWRSSTMSCEETWPSRCGDVVEGRARADDGDEVVVADRLGAGRHDRRVRGVGVLEAGDADLPVVGLGELATVIGSSTSTRTVTWPISSRRGCAPGRRSDQAATTSMTTTPPR